MQNKLNKSKKNDQESESGKTDKILALKLHTLCC